MTNKLLVSLKVLIIQLNPQIGQIDQTIKRTWSILDKVTKSSTYVKPDIILFPEFALTGYSFHSRKDILPHVTGKDEGPSFQLAKSISEKFQCYTIIGYPEKADEQKLYNSALVMNPQGKRIFNYRKTFLYDTEEKWNCEENSEGFQVFPMNFPKRAKLPDEDTFERDVTLKTSIGICMDLSPYKFKAPFNHFEFATFCVDNDVELVLCPMAWLSSTSVTDKQIQNNVLLLESAKNKIALSLKEQGLPLIGSQGEYQLKIGDSQRTSPVPSDDCTGEYKYMDVPDMSNVNYWILRFFPFLYYKRRSQWFRDTSLVENILTRSKMPRDHEYYKNGKHKEEAMGVLNSKGVTKDALLEKTFLGASLRQPWKFEGKNVVLAVANRCGTEDGTTIFAGSSGVYKFNGREVEDPKGSEDSPLDSLNESVELLGNLGKGLEGAILRDVQFEVLR
ncbi:amidase SKDI_10G2640 [Saccharomyces kudriavzevii IFO 1802]|uniref:NTA1-like protein n=2 Tax=Saccharomyces kudriavzevii (strain ATCC MYA-4449 / AS 2.2408 / CBS 8840 / NBRC 1802 / NCYC 2889) TaxID=226230 RepID=J5RH04_SACK1|nr:uncharacterized protein SKDI_10G2640 [Saccharomyces kudriavzevii IFO 1802]EJT41546.1 NTA1-like protein [Saccharomyces kudriavzevii IFO 1802]CAI4043910.1 hypothetical protein SKDI_10G2640 [Saccharomyces kudriavzevii IFO 1802]